jgi:hypothetical protein
MSPEQRSGPIAPQEIQALKTEQIPDEVFAVFNELIAENLHNRSATVLQKDVVAKLEARGLTRDEIYKRRWLDVEESYREVGWKVAYDKPVYWGGENFEPYFKFSDESK